MKKAKKLSVMLLIGLAVSSCTHKAPYPPKIDFYLHKQARAVAICANTEGQECPDVPIQETNNWLMFPPEQWEHIQGYVDHLVCIIEKGCGADSSRPVIPPKEAKQIWEDTKKLIKGMRSE